MTMPQRHAGRAYQWTRDDGFVMQLGKLERVYSHGTMTILCFPDRLEIPDDRRVSEVRRGVFGGKR